MTIRVGDREQKIFTLETKDAVEAIVQYVEAKTRTNISRTNNLTLNVDPDTKLLTLIVTYPSAVVEVTEPPHSNESFH